MKRWNRGDMKYKGATQERLPRQQPQRLCWPHGRVATFPPYFPTSPSLHFDLHVSLYHPSPLFLHCTARVKPLSWHRCCRGGRGACCVQAARSALLWFAYMWCLLYVQYVCVCVSTLELVDFRALRVHVRVIERVACGVALGRQQVLGRVSVRGLWRVVRTGVKSQIWESGGWIASLSDVLVAEVLRIYEPLGPESPADTVAVQGQVDELAWKTQRDMMLVAHTPFTKNIWAVNIRIQYLTSNGTFDQLLRPCSR